MAINKNGSLANRVLVTRGAGFVGSCLVDCLLNRSERVVLQMTRSKSKLQFMPLPQDDPRQRQPVIDEAWSAFSWKPAFGLYQGPIATIKYFTKRVAA